MERGAKSKEQIARCKEARDKEQRLMLYSETLVNSRLGYFSLSNKTINLSGTKTTIKAMRLKKGTFLHTNIKYGSIGILVGLLMSIFLGLFNPKGITLRNSLLNILFSFFITLSISNVIAIVQQYFTSLTTNFWRFVWIYYACSLIGMFIGIELSYFIVSIIFHFKYSLIGHLNDYKFISLLTLVVGTLILLYYFQKRNAEALLNAKEMDLIKLNQLKTKVELQALQSKINPHFLYNALNSIVSLIHEDPDKAEDMTLKLSKLFRYSINTMQENYCVVRDELEILNAYLAIEKVRFGNRIQFYIEAEEASLEKQIPRFLLQPLVENSLKHGLKDSSENGELKVDISLKDNRIVIYIFDNGIPFPEELAAGYGLQSTFDKLQLLYKEDYDLQFNNEPKKHIKISIPLI